MSYSTDLTNTEWFILEPILHQILPIKKATRPSNWTQREILNGIFYQLKNGCNWQDLSKDLPPDSTVYWYYKQWRSQGVLEELMRVLHSQVRDQVKNHRSGLR
jgi:transposase